MLEKTYQPAEVEGRIYAAWEAAGAFKAGAGKRRDAKPYCIVIPPPNVTGSLHMGHALNNTLQDVLVRFERLRGRDVLWQPGMDHAGIATQMVVERKLSSENNTDRRTIGRKAFVDEVWRWKAESGGAIINQLKRLGASCDWSRDRFTMDEGLSRAVLKVFVELYNKGLIYKDKRLVNWDPKFQTAISDLEVEQEEHRGSFKWADGDKDKDGTPVPLDFDKLGKGLARDPNGHMYYFRYPLAGLAFDPADARTYLVVATTRPETMLGDTAVAVHPEHPRYGPWIGRSLELPLAGREIPIIGDDYADPEKGTGAVKITPAHDFNDFEVGLRHREKLASPINILDAAARLNEAVPEEYQGLDRFDARVRVIADLAAIGCLEKIEPHSHTVPHAQRGHAVVEPWLTDQWYVRADVLAREAIAAVEDGRTKFVPENWGKTYFEWMRNIQPWCISRQLWWGHQIPAWYGPLIQNGDLEYGSLKIFVGASEEQAIDQARQYYGITKIGIAESAFDAIGPGIYAKRKGQLHSSISIWRDPDVLDTWFSSALWPFSTLGWPDQTPELARYYPTSTLVTGFDIIFFWVARMMMMGLEFMRDVPFDTVYIHALVRDEKGQKMSKSKGNVIDPLELIDALGADALRFTLAAMAAQGRDIKLAKSRVEGYRNFATKLWNAARFAEMNGCVRVAGFDPKSVTRTINQWIAGETERAARAITEGLEAYKFNEAAGAAYQFVWGTYCDWYLELAKPVFAGADEVAKSETRATAAWVLDQILALLHPFMPFITEELWAKTAETGPARASLLALSEWPSLSGLGHAAADAEIGWVIRLVNEIRSVRSVMNVAPGAQLQLVLTGANAATAARAERHGDLLKRLARLSDIAIAVEAPKGAVQIVIGEATAVLPLAGVVDLAAERQRLNREIDRARSEIEKIDGKLANAAFVAKAPDHVVEENRERRADFSATIEKLQAALQRIAAAA